MEDPKNIIESGSREQHTGTPESVKSTESPLDRSKRIRQLAANGLVERLLIKHLELALKTNETLEQTLEELTKIEKQAEAVCATADFEPHEMAQIMSRFEKNRPKDTNVFPNLPKQEKVVQTESISNPDIPPPLSSYDKLESTWLTRKLSSLLGRSPEMTEKVVRRANEEKRQKREQPQTSDGAIEYKLNKESSLNDLRKDFLDERPGKLGLAHSGAGERDESPKQKPQTQEEKNIQNYISEYKKWKGLIESDPEQARLHRMPFLAENAKEKAIHAYIKSGIENISLLAELGIDQESIDELKNEKENPKPEIKKESFWDKTKTIGRKIFTRFAFLTAGLSSIPTKTADTNLPPQDGKNITIEKTITPTKANESVIKTHKEVVAETPKITPVKKVVEQKQTRTKDTIEAITPAELKPFETDLLKNVVQEINNESIKVNPDSVLQSNIKQDTIAQIPLVDQIQSKDTIVTPVMKPRTMSEFIQKIDRNDKAAEATPKSKKEIAAPVFAPLPTSYVSPGDSPDKPVEVSEGPIVVSQNAPKPYYAPASESAPKKEKVKRGRIKAVEYDENGVVIADSVKAKIPRIIANREQQAPVAKPETRLFDSLDIKGYMPTPDAKRDAEIYAEFKKLLNGPDVMWEDVKYFQPALDYILEKYQLYNIVGKGLYEIRLRLPEKGMDAKNYKDPQGIFVTQTYGQGNSALLGILVSELHLAAQSQESFNTFVSTLRHELIHGWERAKEWIPDVNLDEALAHYFTVRPNKFSLWRQTYYPGSPEITVPMPGPDERRTQYYLMDFERYYIAYQNGGNYETSSEESKAYLKAMEEDVLGSIREFDVQNWYANLSKKKQDTYKAAYEKVLTLQGTISNTVAKQ